MDDFVYKVVSLLNSPEYQDLSSYYTSPSPLDIVGRDRDECVHSNVLAWLLDIGGSHGLGDYPLRKFLQMLVAVQRDFKVNESVKIPDEFAYAFASEAYEVILSSVETEVVADGFKDTEAKGRVDVLLKMTVHCLGANPESHKDLVVIIENKVDSFEHRIGSDSGKKNDNKAPMQTDGYFDWAQRTFPDQIKLFVFLTPELTVNLCTGKDACRWKCANDKYLLTNYQSIVDFVVEPCLRRNMQDAIRRFLVDYLKSLSFTFSTKKERRSVMAVNANERQLLNAFWTKNKELLMAVLSNLADDASSDMDPEVRESVKNLDKTFRGKYIVDGQQYCMGRAVLAAIRSFVNSKTKDGGTCKVNDVKEAFPDRLASTYHVVRNLNDTDDKAYVENNSAHFFKKEDELVTCGDCKLAVTRDWVSDGKAGNRFSDFVKAAKKVGVTISEVDAANK